MFFAAVDSEVASAPWDPPPPPDAPLGVKRRVSKLGTQFQEAAKGARIGRVEGREAREQQLGRLTKKSE